MTSQRVRFCETNLVKRDARDPGRKHPGRRRRTKGMEGVGGHNEGVSECTDVGSIKHFFGEDVARVDGTRDVVDIHLLCLNNVTDGTIFEVDMVHTFGSGAFGPVNSHLVVVVETGRAGGVREGHVVMAISEGEDLLDYLVRGAYFGFAGGAAC